jgi:hypothetical protein
VLSFTGVALAEHPPAALARPQVARSGMSAMGKRAAAVRARIEARGGLRIQAAVPSMKAAPGPAKLTVAGRPPGVSPIPSDGAEEEGDEEPDCSVDPACLDEGELPRGTQAETSIAIDKTGQHIVVGFNDFRGFNLLQTSVSGFMYSDDGGKTFVDGGQLPGGPPDQFGFPQVFGDPDVKYLGDCRFVYSSILLVVKNFAEGPGIVQTMSLHRSSDCGHTWEGPFEVTAASNPSGLLDPDGFPVDAADKEFIDHDGRTGRLLMTWTNFTDVSIAPGGTQILSTYSDAPFASGGPTFSPATIISATAREGTGSIPRFGPEKNRAYVVWRRLPGGATNSMAFARSDDDGKTWSAPVEISAPFFVIDQILGNDRVHSFPSMAVDKSSGKSRGNIYVVYAANDLQDGADIMLLRSNNGGQSFIGPVALNSRPGNDRAQWFPAVSVDDDTGRVFVHFYDQGIAGSGDLTEVSYVFSDDGGKHWSAPAPLNDRPFHAGWGNDTSQPNLGDYNQSVAQRGKYYPVFALASRPPAGFVDGQPDLSLTVPDAVVKVLPASDHRFGAAPLDWQGESFFDSGRNGAIDPGELLLLNVKLRNYVTNPGSKGKVEDITARLTSSTPGVDVLLGFSAWRDLQPGETGENRFPFILFTRPSFVPGTPIELRLEIASDDNPRTVLLRTVFTGTPQPTVLISENFDGSTGIPAGWRAVAQTGNPAINWRIEPGSASTPGFCGTTSNGAFHVNTAGSAWQRLFSPAFAVPAGTEYVTVDFDVCYDTEDEPLLNIWAYDGLFLRVTDVTTGHSLRSVLAEAFADEFTTDGFFHYPKHFPRNSDPAYFEDMSAWAGASNGFQHVHLRLPGMAGTTAQLRFEYAQDQFGSCADVRPGHSCGVIVDNVRVQAVTSAPKQP